MPVDQKSWKIIPEMNGYIKKQKYTLQIYLRKHSMIKLFENLLEQKFWHVDKNCFEKNKIKIKYNIHV